MPFNLTSFNTIPPPALVHLDGRGYFTLSPLEGALPHTNAAPSGVNSSAVCPETHFSCPEVIFYCLPVYVRCNGVYDCPGHEDELQCHTYTCPGFYRCRGSIVCLHVDHLCDGVYQCPERDDELLCDLHCPPGCTCYGWSFFCQRPFNGTDQPLLRFLDAGGSGMPLRDLVANKMLLHLNIARSKLLQMEALSSANLLYLDLSDNYISVVTGEDFKTVTTNLRVLILAGNPISSMFTDVASSSLSWPKLHTLDVSRVAMLTMVVGDLAIFPNLWTLNLSDTGLEVLSEAAFQPIQRLRVLDLRGCPMTHFPRTIFFNLTALTTVHADNYKLCCPATLPAGFNLLNCHAPSDEVSSCGDLLQSGAYRVFIAVSASLTLAGNLVSFVYRVFIKRADNRSSFGVIVSSLCVSDFLMGLYSSMIAVADRWYLGRYLWNDITWRKSAVCKGAGFLSLLSTEVSAFIICLITLDRLLVIRFPLRRELHMTPRSALITCGLAWTVGVALALVPLLPPTSHWQFYSQTGICIPLPITRKSFPGHSYSFGILIILNFVLFLLIAAGQMFIYWSVRINSMSSTATTNSSQNLTIARRLITVAMSDFLCWFPIGLLGLLASSGTPVSSEVNVAIAIFVLPLNSALNPFLYTLNILLERRRLVREQRLQKVLMSRVEALKQQWVFWTLHWHSAEETESWKTAWCATPSSGIREAAVTDCFNFP